MSYNLTSVTTPGAAANTHTFDYNELNLLSAYVPPYVDFTPVDTQYDYNLDRQLSWVTTPDADELVPLYDNAGRPAGIWTTLGTTGFQYYDDTACQNYSGTCPKGHLWKATSADETITHDYHGALPASETWSGAVVGSVSYDYDGDLKLAHEHVTLGGFTGHEALGYDADGLLTCEASIYTANGACTQGAYGAMTIQPDAATGAFTGSRLDLVGDYQSYNAYGEPAHYDASFDPDGDPVQLVSFDWDAQGAPRDPLGRIVHFHDEDSKRRRGLDVRLR